MEREAWLAQCRARAARWRAANRERKRENDNAYYRRNKTAGIRNLGGRCARCGSAEDLTLDHVDDEGRGGKRGGRGQAAEWARAARSDLENLQLLCSGCHNSKTGYPSIATGAGQRGVEAARKGAA